MICIKEFTQPDPKIIKLAVKHIQDGNPIIYPTDTSYGLGTLQEFSNKVSVLKNRDESKFYSVIVPSPDWILENLEIGETQKEILDRYLPGPFTFILKYKNSDKTLGIRIPDYPYIQNLVKSLNKPLITTSANRMGEPNAYSLGDLESGILKNPIIKEFNVLILDGGKLKKDSQSTIVDLTKNPVQILRNGTGQFIIP